MYNFKVENNSALGEDLYLEGFRDAVVVLAKSKYGDIDEDGVMDVLDTINDRESLREIIKIVTGKDTVGEFMRFLQDIEPNFFRKTVQMKLKLSKEHLRLEEERKRFPNLIKRMVNYDDDGTLRKVAVKIKHAHIIYDSLNNVPDGVPLNEDDLKYLEIETELLENLLEDVLEILELVDEKGKVKEFGYGVRGKYPYDTIYNMLMVCKKK